MAKKQHAWVFPTPVVFEPQMIHRQTFVILHGRGSTADKFSPALLDMPTSSGETLRNAFPHAKLVFLTAARNRATIYKRSYTHQWFDHWHMEEPTKRQDLMRVGLNKSREYVHSILEREIAVVGRENVILWGLSQGCATSLISLLTWPGESFAATVGMCGYLPFDNHIEEIAKRDDSEEDNTFGWQENEDDDPFAHSGDEDEETRNDRSIFEGSNSRDMEDPAMEAVKFLKEEIDIDLGEEMSMDFRQIPVFLGHGTEDEKVPIEHGRSAKNCLELLGLTVKMVEYEKLGHWFSEEMLGDIFDFIRTQLGLEKPEGVKGSSE